MRLALFLVLLAIPLIELALLIKLGQWIGLGATVAIVVGTAIAGSVILHRQGLATLRRAMALTERGTPPLEPAVDGIFLLVAGVLLVTPGLLTDIAGLALLIQPLRRSVAHWSVQALMRRATVEVRTSRYGQQRKHTTWPSEPDGARPGSGTVIEGEFERLDDRTAGKPPRRDPPKQDR